jgi:endonuclease/exonuclease/phosphatase family metal-dependent hydrolase
MVALLCAWTSGCRPSNVSEEPSLAEAKSAGSQQQDPLPHTRSTEPPTAASPESIRVATYNINWGNPNLDAVLGAIRQADADLVCLQETNAQSAAALRREFADDYPHLGFYGSVEPFAAGGFAVLSRLPVTREGFLPQREALFGTCILEVRAGDQLVQVIVVHLQPVLFQKRGGDVTALSVLRALEAAEQTHGKEMHQILTRVRTDVPTLIVGDFNSVSKFQASMLAERGFVDSFAAVNENPDSHPTWHWPIKLGDVTLRIDYIFHSPSFRALSSRVVRTAGSDHYLLLSELALEVFPGRSTADRGERQIE